MLRNPMRLPIAFFLLSLTIPAAPARRPKRLPAPRPAATLVQKGTLVRPLDPTGQTPGTIAIAYEFYPARDTSQPPLGAIVAVEGGPGYGSIASRSYFLGLFQPLLDRRSLLLMDSRGTGSSAAADCPALQAQNLFTQPAIQACGATLGQASDLYSTGLAADDLAAILQSLQLPPIDLYGDSYGTFFSQAFAARHPNLIRTVTLDAAYAVIGADPWYPEGAMAANSAFNAVCARSQSCSPQSGPSTARIQALLDSIRANPITGTAPDGDGTPVTVTANAQGLAYAMLSNASGPVVYRDLDAAARAWTQNQDYAPFLRLVAENQTAANSAPSQTPRSEFSAGLFTAVSCSDYTQIYGMTVPLAPRALQAQSVINQKKQQDPNVFAPFTIDEFLAMPLDYSVVNLCLRWPVPSAAYPPGQPVKPGTPFPSKPVLVLSGDLDSLTPPAQGTQAAALFPNGQQIIVPNSFHVTALADPYNCANTIVRNFVVNQSPGSTACLAQIPEVRLIPKFARQSAELDPATPASGNQGGAAELRLAAAAVYTLGDALARWYVNYDQSGAGLRGGSFTYQNTASGIQFALTNLRWTEDVPISGNAVWNIQTGVVTAQLTTSAGALAVTYPSFSPQAVATISGALNGKVIEASVYAP